MRWLPSLALLLCACSDSTGSAEPPGGPPFEVRERVEETAEVVEVLQAGSYTYIRYKTAADETRWLATLRTEVRAGEATQVIRYASRQDFRSRRLGRDFPLLHFGRIIKETEQ